MLNTAYLLNVSETMNCTSKIISRSDYFNSSYLFFKDIIIINNWLFGRGSSLQILNFFLIKTIENLFFPIKFGTIASGLKAHVDFATCSEGEFRFFKSRLPLSPYNQIMSLG